MLTAEAPGNEVPPRYYEWQRGVGLRGGLAATGLVVVLCVVVMARWDAGSIGDILLGAAAIGMLVRAPHTVAVWAALTLLVAITLTLIVGDRALASGYADLAYYCLAVGCLWAIWDLALERLDWRLPGTVLHERLLRTPVYPYGAVLLLAVAGLSMTIVVTYLLGLSGVMLTTLVLVGLLWSFNYTTALWGCLALTVFTISLAVAGQVIALYTGFLAVALLVVALLWICWQALMNHIDLRRCEGWGPVTLLERNPQALGGD